MDNTPTQLELSLSSERYRVQLVEEPTQLELKLSTPIWAFPYFTHFTLTAGVWALYGVWLGLAYLICGGIVTSIVFSALYNLWRERSIHRLEQSVSRRVDIMSGGKNITKDNTGKNSLV
jgi:hypothetical protein